MKGYIASVVRVGSAMMRLRARLVPAVLALQFFLSALQLLDAFHVWYYPMIHRLVYYLRFDLGFSLVPVLLPVAFVVLACLLLRRDFLGVFVSSVVTLLVHFFFGFEAAVAVFSFIQVVWALFRFIDLDEFLFWFLVLITGFEAIVLIHWVLLPFGITTPLSWFANLELDLFYIAAHLAPLIVLMIMCLWFLRPLSNYLGFDKILKLESGNYTNIANDNSGVNHLFFLGLAIFFAVIGALYPYSPAINPSSMPVGVDVHWYVEWMAEIEKNLYSAFTVERGSRPVILLLIYAIEHVFRVGVSEVVKFFPVLLNPLLVLSIYFMISQASQDLEFAAISSLLTGLGTNITVGMFAYFLANTLGLVFLFSAFGFLFNALRTKNYIYLISASVFGSLAVFTHPWTFIQYYVVMVLFLVYRYFIEKRPEGCLTVLLYLCTTGLADLFKGVLIDGLAGYGSIAANPPQLLSVFNFWDNNIVAFRQRFGGLLSVTILLCIAAYGVYKLKRSDSFHIFLTILLVVSSFYYFMADCVIQSRIVYNIPFGVFTALGVASIIRWKVNNNFKKIFVLFIFLYMVVYMLRSMGNII